ncbi:MAG: DUF4145 domain-containing protein [Deltaproteobacteria bacterium]|jgi:hypothetical protein|nr:DUF4145 domain-containing protein [Deltaproteobacteria bacterium]
MSLYMLRLMLYDFRIRMKRQKGGRMPQHNLIRPCPHCLTERTAFTHISHNLIAGYLRIDTESITARAGDVFNTLWACNSCNRSVGIILKALEDISHQYIDESTINLFSEIESYPRVPDSVPAHVPDRIARFYLDAVKNQAMGIPHGCGKLCRHVLELAVKDRFQETKGTLYERILKLGQSGKLLPDMVEWAHEIRDIGNDATHGDAFTEEEAEDIRLLTEYMLVYLYTLPGILARRASTGAGSGQGGSGAS